MATSVSKTGHVGINVSDLNRSIDFYKEVFDFEVLNRSGDDGPQFAFLGEGGRLLITLWEQAESSYDRSAAGLHHLSFELENVDDLSVFESRLRERDAKIYHQGVVAHAEGADSGGLFFEDPDGTRLEVYVPTGLESHAAPSGDAPTCGFF